MDEFVTEKRACGYRYSGEAFILRRFDEFLCKQAIQRLELSKSLCYQWLAKQPHESARSQSIRITAVRQFAEYMYKAGYSAYIFDRSIGGGTRSKYSPRILTRGEIMQLIEEADQLRPTAKSPMLHVIMPEVLRLLYGCGLRVNEVMRLRVDDVDFVQGVLRINDTKSGKDRLVPPALPLVQRLKKYANEVERYPGNEYFFPSPRGGYLSSKVVYSVFRALLLRCHISHGGRGRGPRLHDLRHTFAVHALLRWYREGADLDARLPVLTTYLGHSSIEATQYYLHLTAELFPEITARSTLSFGDVIPQRSAS
jgi:integrase